MIEIIIIFILVFILIIYFISNTKKTRNSNSSVYSAEYYRGLNYLLNNEDDKALKIFTDLIDVDSSTIETHLALGGVYRRRGEFDKAILIHQNLLSRPKLDKSIKNQSLYELAKDFFSAGLYDKSEKILLNLNDNKTYQESCTEYILLIYELSKDWDSAINFCKNLKSQRIRNISVDEILSHYYCEKAVEYEKDDQLNKSITVLKKAIDVNPRCIRALSMLFKLNIPSNQDLALNYLEELIQIDASFIVILSTDILNISAASQDKKIDERIKNLVLKFSKSEQFSPDLYEFMFNINDYNSPTVYIEKTSKNAFAKIYDKLYENKKDGIETYADLLTMIKDNFVTYSCTNCGYSPKHHIWQCPSCNHWQSIESNTISEKVSIDAR